MTQATDTRELIVESAFACFGKQGLQRATIVDIAKRAGISRSTIYEYFSDKAAIVEACAEHASERFYLEMTKAMDRGSTLEDKLCSAAVFVTQARQVIASEKYFDEDAISLLLTKDAAVLLRECVDFFAPHLSAAKLTGEVRKDLDVRPPVNGSRGSCSRCSARRPRPWIWTTPKSLRNSFGPTWCGDSPAIGRGPAARESATFRVRRRHSVCGEGGIRPIFPPWAHTRRRQRTLSDRVGPAPAGRTSGWPDARQAGA